MKLLLVHNPASGTDSKSKLLDFISSTSDQYGIEMDTFTTSGRNDLAKLSKELRSGRYTRMAVMGGDGTFTMAALASLGTGVAVGIVPTGSANGMASELGVAAKPETAFTDIVLSQVCMGLDMLCINKEHHCLHLGDSGLNARMIHSFEGDNSRGMLSYAKHMAKVISKTEPFEYHVRIGDDTIQGRAVMLAFCNGRKFGTGVSVNKIGSPFDGKFELVPVPQVGLQTLVKAGLSIFEKLAITDESTEVWHAREATITYDRAVETQCDGEYIGKLEQVNIQMLTDQVKFITHRKNPYWSDEERSCRSLKDSN